MLAQDYVLRDGQTSAVATYGAFRLEREDCVERDPPIAVLHYASCTAKVRLTWSSADRKVFVQYEDNGELLSRSYRYPIRENLPDRCALGGSYMAYCVRSSNAAGGQAATNTFGATLGRCSAIKPDQIETY
jgi:hypothetical protein